VFFVNKSQSRKTGSKSEPDQAIALAIIPIGDVDRYKSADGVDRGMRKGETRRLARTFKGSSRSSERSVWNLDSFNQNRPQKSDQSGKNRDRSLPASVIDESDNFPGNSITL
jgi:hypothetical protein